MVGLQRYCRGSRRFFWGGKLLDLSAAISDPQLGATSVRKSYACSIPSGVTSFAAAIDLHFVFSVSILRRAGTTQIEAVLRGHGVSQASTKVAQACALELSSCNGSHPSYRKLISKPDVPWP